MVVGFYFVFLPVIKKSTENFANLIQQSAITWQQSSIAQKQQLSRYLLSSKNILLSSESKTKNSIPENSYLPYIYLLKQNLSYLQNKSVQIDYFPDEKYQYLITLSGPQSLYIYFHQSQIGTSPPYVILSIFLSSLLISILASYLLARRLHRYFQPLINASIKLSKGETPDFIEENGPGEIRQLSKSFHDMSQDVQQLLQNRTTLLTGVSHNLRTPVARIKLALELLPESTETELKNKIDRSLNEIDKTIEQFLKMAEGMNTLAPQICSLNAVIKETISHFDHYTKEINFMPEFECTCEISVTALQQILLNLIENSLRYAGDSSVEIVTQKLNQQINIRVIDHGPGIAEEIKDSVFQPFVSLQTGKSNIPGGTGMGLAICQIIAKAHKWELTLESAPTVGTCASLNISIQPK